MLEKIDKSLRKVIQAMLSLLRLIDPAWLDFVVNHINPLFSVSCIKAKVVTLQQETPNTLSIELKPNKNWTGFTPGQFVLIGIVIGGIRHERYYTLTNDQYADTLRITVKDYTDGLVSHWLNNHLSLGDIVTLSEAKGSLILTSPIPKKMLFIAGGAGITSGYSLIKAALKIDPDADIILAFYVRNYQDSIFINELRTMEATHTNFRIQLCITGPEVLSKCMNGRFNKAHLQNYCSDFSIRETYVCGPPGLIAAVTAHYTEIGLSSRLHTEYFCQSPVIAEPTVIKTVAYLKSKIIKETQEETLLLAAEKAGLTPKFGCRMGICHTCVCTKVQGTVQDLITGVIDNRLNSRIRLCVSKPISFVMIEL